MIERLKEGGRGREKEKIRGVCKGDTILPSLPFDITSFIQLYFVFLNNFFCHSNYLFIQTCKINTHTSTGNPQLKSNIKFKNMQYAQMFTPGSFFGLNNFFENTRTVLGSTVPGHSHIMCLMLFRLINKYKNQ